MKTLRVEPDAVVYGAALAACAGTGNATEAAAIWHEAEGLSKTSTRPSLNILLLLLLLLLLLILLLLLLLLFLLLLLLLLFLLLLLLLLLRIIENKHLTDIESANRVRASARAFTLKVSRALTSVERLCRMTVPLGERANGHGPHERDGGVGAGGVRQGGRVEGRGLHSFTLELNLSNFRTHS